MPNAYESSSQIYKLRNRCFLQGEFSLILIESIKFNCDPNFTEERSLAGEVLELQIVKESI